MALSLSDFVIISCCVFLVLLSHRLLCQLDCVYAISACDSWRIVAFWPLMESDLICTLYALCSQRTRFVTLPWLMRRCPCVTFSLFPILVYKIWRKEAARVQQPQRLQHFPFLSMPWCNWERTKSRRLLHMTLMATRESLSLLRSRLCALSWNFSSVV